MVSIRDVHAGLKKKVSLVAQKYQRFLHDVHETSADDFGIMPQNQNL